MPESRNERIEMRILELQRQLESEGVILGITHLDDMTAGQAAIVARIWRLGSALCRAEIEV